LVQTQGGWFEPSIVATLADCLPEGARLHIASSMPVRDAEYFWPTNSRRRCFSFNRGANGIDGTLSTALGLAYDGPPVTLLIGDLAFLHDSNALLSAPQLRGSLTVVVVNNRGGGIFEHLPVARFEPPFEAYFATPQEADLGLLCGAHKVPHTLVKDTRQLRALLAATLPGLRVLEIRTDRKKDAAQRKELLSAAATAAGLAIAP